MSVKGSSVICRISVRGCSVVSRMSVRGSSVISRISVKKQFGCNQDVSMRQFCYIQYIIKKQFGCNQDVSMRQFSCMQCQLEQFSYIQDVSKEAVRLYPGYQ